MMIAYLQTFFKIGVMSMSELTLQKGFELFLASGRMYWAPRTQAYYERNIGYFMQYAEKKYHSEADRILIRDLPEDILVQYVTWLRSKQRYDSHPMYKQMNVNGTIKSNTVNAYMRAAKAFFNFLYSRKYTSIRFTEGVKLPRGDSDQIIPLQASEVAAIDQVFDRSNPIDLRNLCIIHLMLDAGLRSCEVISLTPRDLIFSAGAIVINRSKGNKSRAVIMCPSLADMLREYVNMCHPTGALFCKANESKGINESVMRALFLRLVRLTGISRLHPHLLRHTFATSYIMGGGNLESLRILLGHYDYSVTRRYLHLASQYQILGTDIYKLDPVFFKKAY